MDTELVTILITNQSGGQVFYFPPEEWARLERDFSNYKQYDHPTIGSYMHHLRDVKVQVKPRVGFWRKLSGKVSQKRKLELEFPGLSIISGQ